MTTLHKDRKARYRDKLAHLEEYLDKLHLWLEGADLELLQQAENYERIFAIYHSAQLSIEVISDVASMCVKDLKFGPKDDYTNFSTLHKEGVIPDDLLPQLVELKGLRNRIVHDYNGLIDDIALTVISEKLSVFSIFKWVMDEWLATN